MDPKVCGKLLKLHQRGNGVDVKPFVIESPSGRSPEKAPRWDLADTEGYNSGNCVSCALWMFSWYVGLYRRKKYIGGCPRGPRDKGHAL